ncbi:MAG: rod shape-determining protein MreC [Candidatus Rokuibacteriota bacterium]|nr:MAG: rod shape-determining protein MreC [Candidatus Rokubacteria bacterium]PYO49837.1 MAG: rod shape-determining protein MreC [Candidatus Rokubacteria bacterium]
MRIRALALLGIVAGVCLLLLTLQMRGRSVGASDALALVTTPIQTVLARVNRATLGVWGTYRDWKNVRAENRRLRDETQRLRVEALRVTETDAENQRLRRLLTLKESLPLETMAGEIIAREWGGWVRSLTINRGRGDAVARLTAVIAPDGLVGRIVDVRAGSSVVQVLTDPASTVGAHVVRTRTPGIIEGEPRGTLRFKYMARDGSGIQVGDVVVTSGLGGLFPGGIPIGRVRTIDDRGSALFSYAQVTPAVDFARIDEVLLLTGGAARDVAASFRSDG